MRVWKRSKAVFKSVMNYPALSGLFGPGLGLSVIFGLALLVSVSLVAIVLSAPGTVV